MTAYSPMAPFYNELMRDVPYDAFADFYEKIWEIYGIRPDTVLDLACGTGTLTAIMAARGYEMIAVDRSAEMLSEAVERFCCLEGAIMPLTLQQPMTELDLYGTVNAAYCSLDGINYVPGTSLREVFHRLHLFIEPGGVLIFDINSPFKLRSQDGQVYVDETEDFLCLWRTALSENGNALEYGVDIFSREGKLWRRYEEEHREYIHTVAQLSNALEQEGFSEIKVFGELELRPPVENEGRIFIAARRNR